MDNNAIEQEIISLQQKGKTKEEITLELLKKGATSEQLISLFEKIKEDNARKIVSTPNYISSRDTNSAMSSLTAKQPNFLSSFAQKILHMFLWSIFFLIVLSAFSFGSSYIMAQNYKSLAQKARISGDLAKAEEYDKKSQQALQSQVLSEWFSYFGFMKSVMNDIEALSNNAGTTAISTSTTTVSKKSFLAVDQKGIFTSIRKRDLVFYTLALERYKKDTGAYPPGISQIERPLSATEVNICAYLFPKYIPQLFLDPVFSSTYPSLATKNCRQYDTGYTVKLTTQNTLFLNAPYSENAVNSSSLNPEK